MKNKIGINVSFLRKPATGIGQVAFNVLRTLNNLNSSDVIPAKQSLSSRKVDFFNEATAELAKNHLSGISTRSAINPTEITDKLFFYRSQAHDEKYVFRDDSGSVKKNFRDDGGSAKYFLYAEEDFDLKLKDNFVKRVFLPPYKRDDLIRKIWWEKFCLPKRIGRDGCRAFISLYQCPTVLPRKIKHTMVVHDIIPKLFPEYLNNWRKKLYWKLTEKGIKKADKIIAISECTKNDLIKHLQIPAEKIEVRYLDVDEIYKKEVDENESTRVLQKYNLEKGYIYFGGGLEKRKNVETLLKAYKLLLSDVTPPKYPLSSRKVDFSNEATAELTKNHLSGISTKSTTNSTEIPDKQITNRSFHSRSNFAFRDDSGRDSRISKTSQPPATSHQPPNLVVSGKLMPELAPLVTDVEKLVKEFGLEDKVRLLDFVPQEDLPALYKNARMFIYPSLYEGFGLPVLEAMNCGTPVICSNASSLPEVGGEAVEYFNPKDEKELAEKMKKFLQDDDLRQEFSIKGKKQAKKFSWEKFVL